MVLLSRGSSLAALIPYAVSPQILSQIAVAEDMIVEAMAPLGLDMTKLKEAIALLGVGKMVRSEWKIRN